MSDNPQKFTGAGCAAACGLLCRLVRDHRGSASVPAAWLAAKGLEAGTIGAVLALPMIVRVFTIPVVARAADRNDFAARCNLIATAASVLGYVVLGFAQGAIAIMGLFCPSIAFAPVMPLIDTLRCAGSRPMARAYGPVRLWGSASFIVASLGAGTLLDLLAPRDLIWLVVAAMALYGGLGLLARAARKRRLHQSRHGFGARIVARPDVPSQSPLQQARCRRAMRSSTASPPSTGRPQATTARSSALWALGVVAEIILFAASARLRISPTTLVLLGAVAP
jgi:PPP family 3-phenylpropionic acid transporter